MSHVNAAIGILALRMCGMLATEWDLSWGWDAVVTLVKGSFGKFAPSSNQKPCFPS